MKNRIKSYLWKSRMMKSFIDGKKVENNEFLFENKKIHVPTGIEYHGNMYVTLGLIALVIILHLINKS